MKKFLTALSIAIATFLFIACNNSKKANKMSDTLVFDCVNFDTIAQLTNDANSPKCTIKIKLFYAMGPNASLINDSILNSGILPEEELKRGAKKTIPRAVEIFSKNYIKAYKKNAKQLEKNDPENMIMEQEFNLTSSYAFGKDSLINYEAESYAYSGGAHAMTFSIAVNFDPQTGKLVSIKDIMTANAEEKIIECIVNNICKQYNVSNLDGLKDNGIFDMFDPYIPDNYIIGKDTLTFVYEADEIGPHSYGQIRAKFAYSELEGLIK